MKLKLLTSVLCCAPLIATAADVRDTPCKTTQECEQESNRIRGVITQDATSALAKAQDTFYWFGRINMASTVMLLEENIIPAQLAKAHCRGRAVFDRAGARTGWAAAHRRDAGGTHHLRQGRRRRDLDP